MLPAFVVSRFWAPAPGTVIRTYKNRAMSVKWRFRNIFLTPFFRLNWYLLSLPDLGNVITANARCKPHLISIFSISSNISQNLFKFLRWREYESIYPPAPGCIYIGATGPAE